MSEHLKGARYVGRRYPFQSPQGGRIEMHVVAVDHENGPWESIFCKTEGQARAIVAAPDLLEALRGLKDALYSALDGLSHHDAMIFSQAGSRARSFGAALMQTDAAIAKATGKETP